MNVHEFVIAFSSTGQAACGWTIDMPEAWMVLWKRSTRRASIPSWPQRERQRLSFSSSCIEEKNPCSSATSSRGIPTVSKSRPMVHGKYAHKKTCIPKPSTSQATGHRMSTFDEQAGSSPLNSPPHISTCLAKSQKPDRNFSQTSTPGCC